MSSTQKKISYKFSITNLVLVNEVYPFDFFLRVRGVNTQQSQDSPIIEANKMQCDEVFPWEFAMKEILLRVQFVQITKNTRIEVLRAYFNVNEITDEDGETVAMLASRSSKKLCIVTYKLQPYTQIRQANKQKPKQKPKNQYKEEDEEQQRNDTSPEKDKKNIVLFSKQQHDQLSKQIAQINKSIDKILENQKNQHALFNKYLDQSTSFIKEIMNNSRANRYNDSDNENEGEDGKNNKGNTQNILKQIQQQSQPQLDSINNSGLIKPNQNPNQIQNEIVNQLKQNQQQVKPQKAEIKQSTSAKWYKYKYNKLRSQKIAKNINYRKQNLSNSQVSSVSQPSEFSLQYSQNNHSPSSSSVILSDLSVNSSVKPYQIKISQLLLQDIKDNENPQSLVKGNETQPKIMKKQNKEKKDNLLLTIKSKSGPCYDWKKAFQLPNKKCYIIGIVGNANGNKEKQKQIELFGCIGGKQLQRGKVPLFDNKGQQKGYIRFNHKLLNAYSVQTHQLLNLSKLSENHQEQQQNQIKNQDKQIKQEKNKQGIQKNNSQSKKQLEKQNENKKIDEQGQQQEQDQQKERHQNKENQINKQDKENESELEKEIYKQKQTQKEKQKEKEKQREQRYQLKLINSKDAKNTARIRRLSMDKGKTKQGQTKLQKQQLQNKQQALQSQQQGQRRRVQQTQRFKEMQKERSKQKFKLYKVIYEDKDKNQNQKNNQKLSGEKQKEILKEKEKEKQKQKQKEKETKKEIEKQQDNEKDKGKEKQQEQKQQKQKQQPAEKQEDKKNKKYNLVSNSISVAFLPLKKQTISEQSMHRRTPFLSEEQVSSINSSQFISKIKTINLKIDSVSAKLSKNPNQFAGKFVKLSIRNKNPYITETINLSQNLIWQCKGCIFDSVSPYAQMLVQLCSDQNSKLKTIGKAKICLALLNMQKQNRVQFYHQFLKDQNDNQIGQLIIGYDNVDKTRRIQSGKKSVNKSVQHSNNLDDGFDEQNEHNLTVRQEDVSQRKRKGKAKTKSKSKSKKKPEGTENTNRTEKKNNSNNIGMDGSQAKLIGSTSAIRSKKYTGGNIIIGRAARFRHGVDQKPGPGKYEMPSTFERHAANT